MSDPEKPQLPEEIEVFEDGWQPLEGNGVLLTQAITTCIGVSIYSPAEMQAYLGHFNADSMKEGGSFDSMIQAAARTISDPTTTRIWVGGGELTPPRTRDYGYDKEVVNISNEVTLAFREQVMENLATFAGPAALARPIWLDKPSYINYALDVATGDEEVTVVDQ